MYICVYMCMSIYVLARYQVHRVPMTRCFLIYCLTYRPKKTPPKNILDLKTPTKNILDLETDISSILPLVCYVRPDRPIATENVDARIAENVVFHRCLKTYVSLQWSVRPDRQLPYKTQQIAIQPLTAIQRWEEFLYSDWRSARLRAGRLSTGNNS